MKTSLHTTASFKIHEIFSLFVISKISSFSLFKSVLFLDIIHLLSHTIISENQYKTKSFIIAVHAAQSQFTTIFTSSFSLLVIFSEFIIQAKTTIAVQCWSSWKTGISNSSFNLFSISKHLGADISSRFIHHKVGEICFIVEIISSVS
jgi:hypothetical protein